jgi:hypothetical protein
MITSKTLFAIIALSFSTVAVGCASVAPVESATESPPVGQSNAELEAQVTVFTKAVFERDPVALSAVVSSEIHARLVERGMDLAAFIEKQRSAIASTFELADGERPAFEVAGVVPEGDAVRVTLRFRGEDLKKPFYFVREAGALKINIAPPGFAKAAPDGALFGRSSYQVHNANIYPNPPRTMKCYNGTTDASVTVASQGTQRVTCTDNCGWWSGTAFRLGDGRVKKCDWNSWGDDVVINLLDPDGWHCNDSC